MSGLLEVASTFSSVCQAEVIAHLPKHTEKAMLSELECPEECITLTENEMEYVLGEEEYHRYHCGVGDKSGVNYLRSEVSYWQHESSLVGWDGVLSGAAVCGGAGLIGGPLGGLIGFFGGLAVGIGYALGSDRITNVYASATAACSEAETLYSHSLRYDVFQMYDAGFVNGCRVEEW